LCVLLYVRVNAPLSRLGFVRSPIATSGKVAAGHLWRVKKSMPFAPHATIYPLVQLLGCTQAKLADQRVPVILGHVERVQQLHHLLLSTTPRPYSLRSECCSRGRHAAGLVAVGWCE
jgi:hypothetical protein